MPLPLLLKAALVGGAAYAATRWYTSQRPALRRAGNLARPRLSSDLQRATSRPSTDAPERPQA